MSDYRKRSEQTAREARIRAYDADVEALTTPVWQGHPFTETDTGMPCEICGHAYSVHGDRPEQPQRDPELAWLEDAGRQVSPGGEDR